MDVTSILLGIVGLIVVLILIPMPEKDTTEEDKALYERLSAAATEFEGGLGDEWLVSHNDGAFPQRGYLMLREAQPQIRYIQARFGDATETLTDRAFATESIIAVEIEQETQTVMNYTSTASTKTAKRSPLMRAAVGGMLLGGVGAIVGATSAGSTSKTDVTTEGKSQTVKGAIYLIIATNDIQDPMIKIEMPDMITAQQWLYRLRGLMAG